MAYKMKTYEAGTGKKLSTPSFSVDKEEFLFTSIPVAVTSWVLESIGFRELTRWSVGTSHDVTSPPVAAKAMVMTMSMGPERPAIENVSAQFDHEPLQLYFDSIGAKEQLDPNVLARTLTKIHEASADRLFMSTSVAIRTFFGVKSRAVHSDTTSVSVWGDYDVYNEDKEAWVINSNDTREYEQGALYITRGYSKDKRPDLKQYMLGDAVDDDGIPWVSNVLDSNTADRKWNMECLEILKETLQDEKMVYVADSKLVIDPLVNMMLDDGIMFLSRCSANFDDLLLDKTLMSFDLGQLRPMENISERKKAAKRRITSTTLDYKGRKLRAVLVETSTLAGKGEKAVEKAEADFRNSISSFKKEYNCRQDAEKAFNRFAKKHSKGYSI